MQFGDAAEGFSVIADKTMGSVRVRAWGFWGASVAAAFPDAVEKECTNSGIPIASLVVTLEANDLKPQREEGERAFAAFVAGLARLGVTKVAIATNPLTKLQILRVAKENKTKGLLHFVVPGESQKP